MVKLNPWKWNITRRRRGLNGTGQCANTSKLAGAYDGEGTIPGLVLPVRRRRKERERGRERRERKGGVSTTATAVIPLSRAIGVPNKARWQELGTLSTNQWALLARRMASVLWGVICLRFVVRLVLTFKRDVMARAQDGLGSH